MIRIIAEMATYEEVAKHLDISRTWVQKLEKKGVIPRRERGAGFDLDACRVGYIRSIRTKGSGKKSRVSISSLTDEDGEPNYKELVEYEKYRKLKRENDSADSIVVPVEEASNAILSIVSQIRPVLEGLHLQLKRACPELSADALEKVQVEISKASIALSQVETDRSTYG